jgi:branched-chain amino acid aminotransferase
MLDGRGFVAETNATHLFAVIGGVLCTPHAVACPEGITRATVMSLTQVVVRDISLAEMYTASEVFCTGTMGEIAGVVEIDGRRIGSGEIGPVTRDLAARYQAHARAHGTPLALTP